ncbi:hypothetical protein AUO94_14030 [Planococcus kocurii]|uniref:Uncharacterized protein n=1 Tax=Planococcus kocurii TaxID=1374 RepID=A0ABN4JXS8_9BACL|nr:hypothetical protein AUO94_14030 [Planococcus kocurii]
MGVEWEMAMHAPGKIRTLGSWIRTLQEKYARSEDGYARSRKNTHARKLDMHAPGKIRTFGSWIRTFLRNTHAPGKIRTFGRWICTLLEKYARSEAGYARS